ncbi:histidine--tRNA ligase [Nocardia seriolae]|nr:histidine--tRNA ligase [Nocardia seriolae]MTJ73139.1 histidine--tRNA ligase [Nocardia seriolae]MTJ89164.1 histidine--tRNA ligase [Nocardia seriolae]MTK33142.1 histidine--tRNA ligase [Nocardia seriolae]MTK42097.1 histidine--tRNA ligase [Nocardia seriolae]
MVTGWTWRRAVWKTERRDQDQQLQCPEGVPDYLPPTSAEFVAVRDGLVATARLAGYGHIELPVFEETALFARGVGESTDVVSKEMWTFADRNGESFTLRPEGTAGVMRAVIEHNLDRGQLPVKLCYAGPFFRYERPQKGRYRQLQQVGVEAIGIDDPALDAEVIAIADAGFRGLGLDGFRLEITSLGDETCRPQYRELLQDFLLELPLDEETKRRAQINPLRVLDDKRPEVKEMTAGAPLMIDHLSESAKAHFEQVLGHLDALGVPYVVNPRMVRGLDYYTKTTFEFVHDGLGAQSGIGGGGRYDGLMAELGGQPLSGIGFGIGVDRTVLALEAEGKSAVTGPRIQVYGVPLGDVAKQRLVVIAAELRKAGIRTDLAYGGRGMKGAMKAADKSGAQLALVLGDREVAEGQIGLKNLATGEQRQIPLDEAVAQVATALAGQQD